MSYFAISKEQFDLYDGDKKLVRGQYLVHVKAKKYASVETRKKRDEFIEKERIELERVSRGD